MPCGSTTPLSCELRRLGFSLTLHCSALFNHGQLTPFIVFIAAFGRFMRRSRIPKHSSRHIYSRCEVRSCGALAGARTLGVNMLSENAFKEMPTLANRWSNFRFSSGIQVYFWTQRVAERRPPFETAKLHAAGAHELLPKVAGTSRANFRISRPLRRVRRPRPAAAEVPRRRHDSPIGQAYGGLRFIPIGLWNGDLLNYPPLTAKCRCSDGPRALPRMKTED